MSLGDIALHKFNRDSRRDDAIVVIVRRAPVPADPASNAQLVMAAGLDADEARGLSLTEYYAYKIDRDNTDDRPWLMASSRGPALVDAARHARLLAEIGLSPGEVQGSTLSDVALIKYYRETETD
jgi:hypothetical protein